MAEANWYVVHTYSGYENKVKADLEKTIKNRNLQDQIQEVSVPMLAVTELKNGLEKQADKKMFPGYVLVRMVMNQDTWYVVRNTRGVTGFVGPGSEPTPLSEEEMLNMGFAEQSEPEMLIDFEVGDMITVISGFISVKLYINLRIAIIYAKLSSVDAVFLGKGNTDFNIQTLKY